MSAQDLAAKATAAKVRKRTEAEAPRSDTATAAPGNHRCAALPSPWPPPWRQPSLRARRLQRGGIRLRSCVPERPAHTAGFGPFELPCDSLGRGRHGAQRAPSRHQPMARAPRRGDHQARRFRAKRDFGMRYVVPPARWMVIATFPFSVQRLPRGGHDGRGRLDAVRRRPNQLFPVRKAATTFPTMRRVHASAETVHAWEGLAQVLHRSRRERHA